MLAAAIADERKASLTLPGHIGGGEKRRLALMNGTRVVASFDDVDMIGLALGDLTPEQVLASIIYSGGSAGDNQPPVAEDDNVVTPAGTPVQFNVLTNDFDPDGDAISLSTVGAPQS